MSNIEYMIKTDWSLEQETVQCNTGKSIPLMWLNLYDIYAQFISLVFQSKTKQHLGGILLLQAMLA